jgi:hypothetical protein
MALPPTIQRMAGSCARAVRASCALRAEQIGSSLSANPRISTPHPDFKKPLKGSGLA